MRSVDNHFDFAACVKYALRVKTVRAAALPAVQVPEANPYQYLETQDITLVSIGCILFFIIQTFIKLL